MKKVLSFMLSLLMITTVFALPFNASAIEPSGNINENISYTFDSESGLLTVTGTGQLPNDYTFNGSKAIKKIVIGEGITEIDSETFNNCSNVTELVLPSTLECVQGYGFGNLAITEINLPEGFTTASSCAFAYCENVTSIS
ncbi:MAG: leucine-rich repeat domain-containing protein, partial [Eubacterium sp.]|nr:leucine-rich repeat domain-containing protein [Eubacterium sp.]